MENYNAERIGELESTLKQVLGAIKGGWHENDEPEYTQRFGLAFINHIESILDKGCKHEWVPKQVNELSKYSPFEAVCRKCGSSPNPLK